MMRTLFLFLDMTDAGAVSPALEIGDHSHQRADLLISLRVQDCIHLQPACGQQRRARLSLAEVMITRLVLGKTEELILPWLFIYQTFSS